MHAFDLVLVYRRTVEDLVLHTSACLRCPKKKGGNFFIILLGTLVLAPGVTHGIAAPTAKVVKCPVYDLRLSRARTSTFHPSHTTPAHQDTPTVPARAAQPHAHGSKPDEELPFKFMPTSSTATATPALSLLRQSWHIFAQPQAEWQFSGQVTFTLQLPVQLSLIFWLPCSSH